MQLSIHKKTVQSETSLHTGHQVSQSSRQKSLSDLPLMRLESTFISKQKRSCKRPKVKCNKNEINKCTKIVFKIFTLNIAKWQYEQNQHEYK